MTKDIVIYLITKGYTSRESATLLKVEKTTILRKAKQYGLYFKNTPKRFDTINPVIIKKFLNRNYSNKEIATLLKVNANTISKIISKYHLTRNEIKLSKKEKSFLIGTLLGDSSLKSSGETTCVTCSHSLQQKEYLLWKQNQLKNLYPKVFEYVNKNRDKRTGRCYSMNTLYSKGTQELTSWKKELYSPKKKIFTKLLKHYNAFSLAVHYMDDGTKKGNSYVICTDSFSKQDLILFNEFCKQRFGLYWNITNQNRLYLPTRFKSKFESLIYPFIHFSMMYKLH